jgi:drug/metabolite transporter (DMT)-like permease
MNPVRIVGIALAVVGLILLFFGLNQADSPVDQFSELLTGRYTDQTMWYIIGGVAALVVGVLVALFGVRSPRA